MATKESAIFNAGQRVNTAEGLCLELSAHELSLCEMTLSPCKPLYLARVDMEASAGEFMKGAMGEALKQAQVQLKAYRQTLITWSGKSFTLVPSAFFEESHARTLLEFNGGGTGNDLVLFDDINRDIKVVYSIPEEVKFTFDKLFPNHHLKHKATVLARIALQSEELIHEQVLLDISAGGIYIVAKKGEQMLLCNHYQASTDEDMLYYLLFVMEQFGYNPMTVKVSVSGQTEADSPFMKAVRKYIRQVHLVTGPPAVNREQIPALPHHQYFTLINRLFCE